MAGNLNLVPLLIAKRVVTKYQYRNQRHKQYRKGSVAAYGSSGVNMTAAKIIARQNQRASVAYQT